MSELDDLMQLPGAQAAFSNNDLGELLDHRIAEKSPMDTTTLDLLAHMCVANMAIATMQARGWETSSQSGGFYPVEGFTLVGMQWSAVTNGRQGVVVSNGAADYEAAYRALGADGSEG